jgi:hypothetical protein
VTCRGSEANPGPPEIVVGHAAGVVVPLSPLAIDRNAVTLRPMSRMPFLLCLVAAGCGRQIPPTAGTAEATGGAAVTATESAITVPPAARSTPPPPGDCVGTVAEYCTRLGGECPSYDESVGRRRSLCPHWVVTTSVCGRRYRSVSWREALLGGGEEYFDTGGRLIAAHLYTDYPAYCGGRSFAQTFGTVPTCATKPVERNLCQRPPRR